MLGASEPATCSDPQAEAEAMARRVLELIDERGHVTFAELYRLPGARGRVPFLGSGQTVIWPAASRTLLDAVDWLRPLCQLEHCAAQLYHDRGAYVGSIPTCEFPPAADFDEPTWVPTILRRRTREELEQWRRRSRAEAH